MGRLFGTDGIRGVVNAGLDARLAFQVGMAAAYVMAEAKGGGQPRFTIGKDTRISSDLLEGALVAGLCSAGADVLHLGVIPTPAVAWITVDAKADAGIVISASHNPFEHNGIKIFDHRGFKLSDALEGKIEEIVLSRTAVPLKTHGEIGRVIYADEKEAQDYIDYLVSTVDTDLSGLHILVDCANGAASATAARLFDRFPDLHTDVIHADPDGVNINHGCGSTHLDSLRAMVKAGGYDLGIAFDGDADRCLAVDEMGNLILPNTVSESFGKLLKAHGLRHIRFHDLRHSCASLLLKQGVPMKQIQEWLGHSDISTTANIYAHLDSQSKQLSAAPMEKALALPEELPESRW